MYPIIGLIVPIAGMAMVFGIVYIAVTAENRKNLAMIEAGMNPNEKKAQKGHSRNNLRNALLLIFIPIGLLIGNYIGEEMDIRRSTASLASAFLFGGIALLIFHFIDKKAAEKEEREEMKHNQLNG